MWTTGSAEVTIPPENKQTLQIARSYVGPWTRVDELVFTEDRTGSLDSRTGEVLWLSIQLSFSNSKPVYGVYRLDCTKLHNYRTQADVSESDVAQFIAQFEKRPNLEQLIEEFPDLKPTNESDQ